MRVPIKSKRLEAVREWLYEHPVIATIIAVCAFVFIFLPQWGAAVWQLFTDKPFFVWLSERVNTMTFSAYWITAPIGILTLLFILYLLITGRHEIKKKSRTSETDETKNYTLTFEIDAPRSKLNVSALDNDTYLISLHLYVRFINTDIHPLTIYKVNVSLIRKNEGEKESEIPKTGEMFTEMSYDVNSNNPVKLKNWSDIGLEINGRNRTLYHTIKGSISVSRDYRKMFDSNSFLRVSMEGMNQPKPPYHLDFDVDWQNINQGWVDITPRT